MANDPIHGSEDGLIKEWLGLIYQNDEVAFTKLLRLFWNKVYTQALTYLKEPEIAREVTQDVFLKIWAARKKLPEIEKFSNYLFIVSRNCIISELRKKGRGFVNPSLDLPTELLLPDEQLQYKELQHQLLKVIDQLPPTRKKVFEMNRLEGLTYDEIADKLNISRNGVKDHIVKALNFLRAHPVFSKNNVVSLLLMWSVLYFD
ncbi:RNA polymerase sigma factor [Niabella beijingensis]|uniref:RNA polymerase sigma factor n=1 Tax=Niabella beijingensis TaxID=2872700 RepID=UPI001CBAC17E|nr:RNA polymerase sigma-70 factor [Niabella beijingensis]MBZ4189375.1 RNA polymerase sigma-70 factor [Niabella beijingensis]